MRNIRVLVATVTVAFASLAGCGGKGLPGAPKVPGSDKIPGGVPGVGGGESGLVDPNTCGNYAASEAGKKLKAFLVATQDVEKATEETVNVVKQSCITLGNELGMTEADYRGETKDICAAVYGRLQDNLKVAFKSKSALTIKYTPAVCKVNAEGQVKAAAQCEGKASADFKASCSGVCRGKCDGTCATKGSGGECAGQCNGGCHGQCEGSADVDASAQCQASASVKASLEVQCSEPELSIEGNAKLYVDKAKAEQTIKAMKTALPQILSVKARLVPMKHAVEVWAKSAVELKDIGIRGLQSFKDQATCVAGQIASAAAMVANIQANVSVSVEVSASASGSIGAE